MKRLCKILLPIVVLGVSLNAQVLKHTVKKGDTLYAIAHKHHMTVSKLREINHMTKNSVLKTGKVLYLSSPKKHKKVIKNHKSKKHTTKLAKVLKRRTTINRYKTKDIVFTSKHSSKKAKKIIQMAKKKLGKRYVWGATGSNAFDCSGLTKYVCKLNGINLPRRAIAQSKFGKYVPRSQLKPGDLIFFDTSKHRKGYVNHVGIYIGNGKFIHASSAKHKVTITNLNKPFYSQRFKVARRVAL